MDGYCRKWIEKKNEFINKTKKLIVDYNIHILIN